MVNPYEATIGGNGHCHVAVDSRIAATYLTCLLLLVGFLLFTFCTFSHSCMCGHLKHKQAATLAFHWGLDALLGVVFIIAVYSARRSFFEHTNAIALLLALIYLNHVILANGAGYLFIVFDFPIMLVVAARCVVRLRWARVYATAI